MDTRWRVEVDRARCIGSGMCAGTAPGRFVLDQGQRSSPTAAVMPADEAVYDAAVSCPVEAITLSEAGAGRTVFPEE